MTPTGGKKELSVLTAIRISKEMRDYYQEFADEMNISLSDALREALEYFKREGIDDYLLHQREKLSKMYTRNRKK
jgi:hypothetical protein